jgi:NADPH-dependent glutamate synthase beta subunit-like oxidoreductase
MSASEPSMGKINPAEDAAHERLEVAVIGGSQAGLAMGYYLAQQGDGLSSLSAHEASPSPPFRKR